MKTRLDAPTCGAETKTTGKPCRTKVPNLGDRCPAHPLRWRQQRVLAARAAHYYGCPGTASDWGIPLDDACLGGSHLYEFVCADCGRHSIWVIDWEQVEA